jgi:hypothetical protein
MSYFFAPPRPRPLRLPPRRTDRLLPRVILGDLGVLGRSPLADRGQAKGFLLVTVASTSLADERPKSPPRSRVRKKGRRAGAEAVMRARFVSIAEVTKPMLKVGSGRVMRPKRPWTMRTRRMMEVIVTLSRLVSGL